MAPPGTVRWQLVAFAFLCFLADPASAAFHVSNKTKTPEVAALAASQAAATAGKDYMPILAKTLFECLRRRKVVNSFMSLKASAARASAASEGQGANGTEPLKIDIYLHSGTFMWYQGAGRSMNDIDVWIPQMIDLVQIPDFEWKIPMKGAETDKTYKDGSPKLEGSDQVYCPPGFFGDGSGPHLDVDAYPGIMPTAPFKHWAEAALGDCEDIGTPYTYPFDAGVVQIQLKAPNKELIGFMKLDLITGGRGGKGTEKDPWMFKKTDIQDILVLADEIFSTMRKQKSHLENNGAWEFVEKTRKPCDDSKQWPLCFWQMTTNVLRADGSKELLEFATIRELVLAVTIAPPEAHKA